MSTIRTSNLGPLTGSTASVVDPATPTNGIARVSPLVSFEAKTASGTLVDFIGIPSWARRVTIILNNVSTNGSSNILFQIGSGSFTTSGYAGSALNSAVGSAGLSTGFTNYMHNSAASTTSGALLLFFVSGTDWVATGNFGRQDVAAVGSTAGRVTIAGALDRVRITTANGTDVFDSGTINVIYD